MTLGDLSEAYAAYLNSHSRMQARAEALCDPESLEEFEEDMSKARAALECAWLRRGQDLPGPTSGARA
jgi:hypothetical protein